VKIGENYYAALTTCG